MALPPWDNKTSVIFGAAKQGQEFLDCFDGNIDLFFDNNEKKWNTTINNIKIVRPIYDANYYVIVANLNHDVDMVFQLLQMGYRKFSVIKFDGRNEKGKCIYSLDNFDYSNFSNFETKKNKVALLKNTNSGSNTYCLLYMIEHYLKSESTNFEFKLLDETKRVNSYYYDILTSYFIFLTHSFLSIEGKVIFQCFHAYPFKGTGYFDSNIDDNSFELTHVSNLKSKYILSNGTFYSVLFSACFGVPARKFLISGMPRNDVLQLSDGKTKMNNHFPITKNKRLILYMPTYRERTKFSDDETKGYIFQYDDFSIDSFNSFMEKNNCILVIKMHHADNLMFEHLSNFSNNLLFLKESDFENEDFYEYINACDVLITDYSSIYIDYLYLDKPIIFSHNDIELYQQERPLMFSNLPFWCPGEKITNWKELENAIESIFNGVDNFKHERKRVFDLLYDVKDSNASNRILETLKKEVKK